MINTHQVTPDSPEKHCKAELQQATVHETWSDILWWELHNPRKKTRPKEDQSYCKNEAAWEQERNADISR